MNELVVNDHRRALAELEQLVERELGVLKAGSATVFVAERDGLERACVVLELQSELESMLKPAEVARVIESALMSCLPRAVVGIMFLEPGTLPASNGDERRSVCAERWRDGALGAYALYEDGRRLGVAPAAVTTETEREVARLWQEVLEAPVVPGSDVSFFALGGNSISVSRLLARLEEELGVSVEPRVLFDAPGLRQFTRAVARATGDAAARTAPLVRVPRDGGLPLSPTQRRMHFAWQLAPASAAYNIGGALRLVGDLDIVLLERSFEAVVARHESLRTRFPDRGDGPQQQIDPPARFSLRELDLRAVVEREASLRAAMAAEMARSFDLATGPLFRACAIRLSEREHVLVVSLHHVIADGASINVLVRDLVRSYASQGQGGPAELPPLSAQYADYAAWQARKLESGAAEAQLAYYRQALEGEPPRLELPGARPRPASASLNGLVCRVPLPESLAPLARDFAREHDATVFMVLMAAFNVLLSRETGERDLCVGTVVHNRLRVEAEAMIGSFVNTQVLRTVLGEADDFREVLRKVRHTVLAAQERQDLPFDQLVEAMAPDHDRSRHPLFQIMYNHRQRDLGALAALPGLRATVIELEGPDTRFDLALNTEEDESGQLSASLVYARELFDAARIEQLAEHFVRWLGILLAEPSRPLASIEWLTPDERGQIDGWSTPRAESSDELLVPRIARQVEQNPGAPAAAFGERSLSYSELWERSGRLACGLAARGVGADRVIAVSARRSLELGVALLGILRAGAAYVPLDPNDPVERQAFMLRDSGATLLLRIGEDGAPDELAERVSGVTQVDLDVLSREMDRPLPALPLAHAASLAYVLYTSGTSGRPKAVGNTHGGLAQRLDWMQREYGVGVGDTFLQKTPLGFDVSVWEVFLPWLAGARVVFAPDGAHRDPQELALLILQHHVTAVHFVPSLLQQFITQPEAAACSSLEYLFSGGEALTAELRASVLTRLPALRLDNRYGPTEATINATFWTCRRSERGPVPIGRAIPNTVVRILDAGLGRVPANVAGELYIGGLGLARGYVGRPALTAERFVPDPLSSEPGARLYRTGDVARFRQDGAIEYLGRADRQVKVRGIRVELGEVEASLAGLPGVEAAAVVPKVGPDGSLRLVAYVAGAVGADAALLDANPLDAALRERLAAHLVPSQIVVLERLPRLPSGKLDRAALPEPRWQARVHLPPRSEIERAVAGIWERILGVERVGLDDDFFALGGHSLLATQVVARVRSTFAIELPLRELFEAPVLGPFSERVRRVSELHQGSRQPPLERIDRSGPLPLSHSQERMWFLWQLDPSSAAYNVGGAVRLRGPLNQPALGLAFQTLLARHEGMRTVFPRIGGVPQQVIAAESRVRLEPVSLASVEPAARRVEVERLAHEEAHRPFDLERGPLLRVKLAQVAPDEHVLLVTLHHIIAEGWAMDVFADEFAASYAALCRGEPSPLAPLEIQYADFAAWQRRWLEAGEGERQLDYWRARLGTEHPVLELPTDRPRPPVQSFRGDYHRFVLDERLSVRLHELSLRHRATLAMTLTAALFAWLHRYSGQRDLRIGYPIANRIRPELEKLIGAFLNTQVLRCEVTGDLPMTELIERVRAASLDAQSHQDVPFHRIVEAVAPQRSAAHMPLFQVMMNVQRWKFQQTREVAGLALEFISNDSRAAKCDLSVDVSDVDGRLECSFTYNLDLFDRPTAERMARHWVALLESMAADPSARVADLDLLGSDRAALLGAATREPSEGRCVHEWFEAQAEATPGAVAVLFKDQSSTYAELNARANQVAHVLCERGVGPDELVGVCLERSIDMLVCLLGILKAGGAYVPMDPSYPRERLDHMRQDSGMRWVVTQAELAELLPVGQASVWCIDRDAQDLSRQPTGNLERRASPQNLAYCIYTSGSTGKPKGVAVRHASVENFLTSMRRTLDISPSDRTASMTSLSFDIAVLELYLPLVCGGSTLIVDRDTTRDPRALLPLLARQAVTVVQATPSAWLSMTVSGELNLLRGRTLLSGGEALPPELAARLSALGNAWNVYGPTETTVWSSLHQLAPGEPRVLIGRPLRNTTLHVLDGSLNPVPVGVVGELYIGGDGLARGYHARPSLTAQRFIPDPFGDESGGRLYRTGDLARCQADGSLECLGRVDEQVKIRGYRIELGEIEAELRAQPGVVEAAVAARATGAGIQLCAYVSMAAELWTAPNLPQALREALSRVLPEYMVPAQVVVLAALPKTPNGKLDRKALPAANASADRPFAAPESPVERQLAAIWSEILGVEAIGLDANFFELGGDSIVSLQVISRAQEAGLRLEAKDLFRHQTVRALAQVAVVERAAAADDDDVTGSAPPSPWQRWMLEQGLAARPALVRWFGVERELDYDRLEAALEALVERHAALRLRYRRDDDGRWLGWHEDLASERERSRNEPLLWVHDSLVDSDGISDVVKRASDSFVLDRGPWLRAVLVERAEGQRRLALLLHPLVEDETSWQLIVDELPAFYDLPAVAESAASSRSFKAWAERLNELAPRVGDVPAVAPVEVTTRDEWSVRWDGSRTQQLLDDTVHRCRASLFELLLAALSRAASGLLSTPLAVELVGDARRLMPLGLELGRTLGCFRHGVGIRLEPRAESLAEAIRAAKEQLRGLSDVHRAAGFERVAGTGLHVRLSAWGLLPQAAAPGWLRPWHGDPDREQQKLRGERPEMQSQDGASPALDIGLVLDAGELRIVLRGGPAADVPAESADVAELGSRFLGELERLVDERPSAAETVVSGDFPLAALAQPKLQALALDWDQVEDLYPLSPMQEGLLMHTLLEPGSGIYLMQHDSQIDGAIDVEAFREAWRDVVRRHPVLRTGYVWNDDGMLQAVLKDVELPLEYRDYRHLERQRQNDLIAQDLQREVTRGFDMARAPLWRVLLVRTGESAYRLAFSNHHILMDAWSRGVLFEDAFEVYRALARGERPAPSATPAYREFISWLRQRDLEAAGEYWTRTLEGFERATPLPALRRQPDGAEVSAVGDEYVFLAAEETLALIGLANGNALTINTFLQAAWGLTLARYSGQREVLFGVTVAGRPMELPGIETTVGLFINSIPLRLRLPREDEPVRAWLLSLLDQNVVMRQYEHLPLVKIQQKSQVGRGQPLFDSLFVFENAPVDAALLDSAAAIGASTLSIRTHNNYPLTAVAYPGERLGLHLSYDERVMDRDTVTAMLEEWRRLLLALHASFASPFAALPMVPDAERNQLLGAWNQTRREYPLEAGYLQLFEENVRQHPDRIAAGCGGEQLSYAGLRSRSQRISGVLRQRGVGVDDVVALLGARNLDLLAAVLGVFGAGAAYLPLDPQHPVQRLGEILRASRPAAIVTSDAHRAVLDTALELVPEHERPIVVLLNELAGTPALAFDPHPAHARQLAYVIQTSGSTGKPKGAMVEQAGMLNNQLSKIPMLGLTADDIIAQSASQSFDISVWQLLTAPLCGGRVEILPDDVARDPALLLRYARSREVSVLETVPSLLSALVDTPDAELPALRVMIPTGEALPPELAQRWLQRFPHVPLINAYGPAECSDDVTMQRIDQPLPADCVNAPIGRPTDNNRLYVLGEQFELVPVGVVGELYVSGTGVGRGYLGQPARTALVFVPNPFEEGGERLYRTGDLVRYRADGVLEFVGRVDHQIKIRGHRIELGEIEWRLRQHPSVTDAVAVVHEASGRKRIVAYVMTSGADDAQLPGALDAGLRAVLPEYMLPSQLVLLDQLPLTSNGKVDRRSLPEPDAQLSSGHVAPSSDVEARLADIWREVLGVPEVSVTASFFALGGDSIVALQVVSRARQAGLSVSPRDMFQHDTVRALARVAQQDRVLVIHQGPVLGTAALTPIQHWFFERQSGQNHYNQTVLLRPRAALDAETLRLALEELIVHHDALRLRFERGHNGLWRQRHATLATERQRWLDDPLVWERSAPSAEALRELALEGNRSLDIGVGPLLRAVLITTADGAQLLLLAIHHLVIDGVSWRILLEDLQRAYSRHARGEEVELPLKTTSFKRWADELGEYARSQAARAELSYWTAELVAAGSTKFPRDAAVDEALVRDRASATVSLSARSTARLLRNAPQAYQTEVNDLLLTALSRSLCRFAGQPSVLVELEGHGRENLFEQVDTSRTVGWFTSLFPVRLVPDLGADGPSLARAIKGVKEQLRRVPNKGIGYGVLEYLGESEERMALERLPRPRVTFNYLGQFDQSFDEPALFEPAELPAGCGQDENARLDNWLMINGRVYQGELTLTCTYSSRMYRAETASRIMSMVRQELEAVIEHCSLEGVRGFTPSDVLGGGLRQDELDALISALE